MVISAHIKLPITKQWCKNMTTGFAIGVLSKLPNHKSRTSTKHEAP